MKGTAASGIIYEAALPISCESIEVIPSDVHLAQVNEANEWLLRADLTLSEHQEADEHNELSTDIQRLDLKLNLILSLVGDALAKQLDIPAASPAKLSFTHLEWQTETGFEDSSLVRIYLYVSSSLPKALHLYGRVVASEGGWMKVEFVGINHAVADWLEKMIFRHHRRTVAQSRSKK